MKVSARLEFTDEKKHSVRYDEVGVDGESDAEAIRNSVIGAIYIRKNHLPRPFPKFITVTVEAE